MENCPVVKVAVIGGGIIGISSALRILETNFIKHKVEVTVLSEKYTPYTTANFSAGFWNRCLIDLPETILWSWAKETFEFLLNLSLSPDASVYGTGILSVYSISEDPKPIPIYSDVFLNWRDLTERELQMFPKKYKYGKFYTTLFAECKKLLPYMMKRIEDKGGKLLVRKINNLLELVGEYDVVINCPGIQAVHLVPDPQVFPIRGQTIRVKAPWIKHAVTSPKFYILLNSDEIVCGATAQKDDWNTDIDPNDRKYIWEGCCELVPSLKNAEILRDCVCLRPSRSEPRLERESITNKHNQRLEVIHNYGHGGSGITLCWGCAKDVVQNLQQFLGESEIK